MVWGLKQAWIISVGLSDSIERTQVRFEAPLPNTGLLVGAGCDDFVTAGTEMGFVHLYARPVEHACEVSTPVPEHDRSGRLDSETAGIMRIEFRCAQREAARLQFKQRLALIRGKHAGGPPIRTVVTKWPPSWENATTGAYTTPAADWW